MAGDYSRVGGESNKYGNYLLPCIFVQYIPDTGMPSLFRLAPESWMVDFSSTSVSRETVVLQCEVSDSGY